MTTNENTTQTNDINTVLVTAASGKTGRRVAERLAARGLDVRAGSRTGEVRFDWEDEKSWGPALAGADAAYVTYYPDLAAPGAVEAMHAFGLAARDQGVRRLVLLSGRGEPDAVLAEDALREAWGSPSGLTVVRAAFFAQNFSEGALAEGVAAGEIAFPAGDTAEPWVDAEDLADAVVETLVGAGHGGEVYELTGPRLLTFAEVASELSRATGREVRYVPVTVAEYASALQGYGLPPAEAEWMAGLFGMLLDGHNAGTTDGVRRILGRDPRDFTTFTSATWPPTS
ncbi:NmrA family transcriptional regulator [Streptomyces spiroverticillatus]|uniref:NmrA family transcriptional regulator n=1 Tax=Streptomyces finlayi TaxID=67296 RepID=A0A918WZ40_9ACTN|nr:NmrA family transcriptional regulator [Streptomyces finlayi]GHA13690.1 NmrA family transcriptional regulator [Streptomyces spiroverticillatus]GHC97810.1 NmrA family transcriptional regulator [Streptomyces finlayi]